MDLNNFLTVQDIDILTRILVSIVLGFIIGIEREVTNKSAGLRTHILVCLGSTVFTILSIYAFPTIISPDNPVGYGDPARVAAQIITGIGFIGGGAILRMGPSVFGLTTASSLWVAAAIGMAAGTGYYILGSVVAVSTVVILTTIRTLEHLVLRHSRKKYVRIKVTFVCDNNDKNSINSFVNEEFKDLLEFSVKDSNISDEAVKLSYVFFICDVKPMQYVSSKFELLKNISNFSIKELVE